jgi:hypothetical protein
MNASLHATTPLQSPDTPPQAGNGRDSHGRFARGNPGGPGNPFYRHQAELKRQLLAQVTDADVMSVMRVLLGLARDGDLAAIKLFLEYTVGKPSKEVDPDQDELHEWRLQQQTPRLPQVLEVASSGIEPTRANQVARDLVPIVGNCRLHTIHQHLQATAERAGHPPGATGSSSTRGADQDTSTGGQAASGSQRVGPIPPAPDPNGSKRPGGAIEPMVAGVRPAVQTEDNGEQPNSDALFAEVVRAVHAVENGPERALRSWPNSPPGADQPVGLDWR